jgi:hypothetical protein
LQEQDTLRARWDSRFFSGQGFLAFEDFRFGCERGGFAAENDAVWLFGERFDEFLSVRGNDLQVQKSNVQLFQLFLTLYE